MEITKDKSKYENTNESKSQNTRLKLKNCINYLTQIGQKEK